MKKTVLPLLCALSLSLLLTGCGGQTAPAPEQAPPQPSVEAPAETPAETPAEAPAEAPAQPDPAALYAPVLEQAHALLSGMEEGAEPPVGMTGLWEAALGMGEEAMDRIGFLFRDLNGDQTPELLIGSFDKEDWAYTGNEIYAVYTLAEGSPLSVMEGSSRSAYALNEDNTFFYTGSNGAAYSISAVYRMEGTGLVCVEYLFTYPEEDRPEELAVYRNTTGEWDPALSEKLDMTADELWAGDEARGKATAKLEATPLSQLELPTA